MSKGFGLTPHEYELVRSLPDSAHCFLIKHGNESVVVRLNLSGERELLTILSGRERTVRLLDELRAEHGDAPDAWYDALMETCLTMAVCDAIPSPESFAPSVLHFLDCQAQLIGAEGYRALAAPGSMASILLTGMVTLLIAFLGYRMLLGHAPTIREGVLTFVKIGLVLVLATSWPAYHDTRLRHHPARARRTRFERNRRRREPCSSDQRRRTTSGPDRRRRPGAENLAIEGVGPVHARWSASTSGQPLDAIGAAYRHSSGFDSFALGFARVILLVSTVASFAVVRIAAAILLAMAPSVIATFLLFDGTRGLFEGWLKAIARYGARTASRSPITLGIELALYRALAR